jgi:hypothetical protein
MPIHFALLGRKQKYLKSKTTAKLRKKRTSIAAVRAKLGQFDIFQTPLLSGCRLPLKKRTLQVIRCGLPICQDIAYSFCFTAVLRIRIHRIHMFLGLPDPDPDLLVRGMDPDPDPALDPDPNPSIIMQK